MKIRMYVFYVCTVAINNNRTMQTVFYATYDNE